MGKKRPYEKGVMPALSKCGFHRYGTASHVTPPPTPHKKSPIGVSLQGKSNHKLSIKSNRTLDPTNSHCNDHYNEVFFTCACHIAKSFDDEYSLMKVSIR